MKLLAAQVLLAVMTLTADTDVKSKADPVLPPITLPVKIQAASGDFVEIVADTKGTVVKWIFDPALKFVPQEKLANQKSAIVLPPGPGTYKVQAYTAVDNIPTDLASTSIVVGGTPPIPDPLVKAIQDAYATDAGADKAASLAFLQSAYKGMAANVKPGLATNADALAWLKSVVEAPGVGLTPAQIVGVRKAIATDLVAALGTSATAPLDAAKFQTELAKIAAALGGVK